MKISREFYARLFVYGAAAAFLGSALLLFLQTLQVFLETGDWRAWAAWAIIAATWANLTFVLTRRFVSRVFGYRWYPALIPLMLCLPVPAFMLLREEALLDMVAMLIVPVIAASSYFGYRLGVKAGDTRREEHAKTENKA